MITSPQVAQDFSRLELESGIIQNVCFVPQKRLSIRVITIPQKANILSKEIELQFFGRVCLSVDADYYTKLQIQSHAAWIKSEFLNSLDISHVQGDLVHYQILCHEARFDIVADRHSAVVI